MDKKNSSCGSGTLPVAPVAGVKRPAPSLLPAFEPLSPSSLPRPAKRQARVSPHDGQKMKKYPTPIPTSSTGMASSPPPPEPVTRRAGLTRTMSGFSERAPLVAVPSIELDRHGEPTLMGRSSNSSHYQLSTKKLVSRVHVRAVYIPADPPAPKKVQVECMGWNGVTVHCQGKAFNLRKGDSFTSDTEDAGIIIDVHDARVLLNWPRYEAKLSTPTDSDSPWDDENSPRQTNAAGRVRTPQQSPLREQHIMHSPVSPSPAVQAAFNVTSPFPTPGPSLPAAVQIYEDEPSGDEIEQGRLGQATQSTQHASQPLGDSLPEAQSSPLSLRDEFSDGNEENDPIIHSFGPYGSNLLPRLEAMGADSSDRRRPLKAIKEATASPQGRSSDAFKDDDKNSIINHVINQLAYSRLSSTPLSTLMANLPQRLRATSPSSKENADLSLETLKMILDMIPCVGEVSREGKDAAGKALESEYHYIPEMDSDDDRSNAVVDDLKKPGLRACRKHHKVCFQDHGLFCIKIALLTCRLAILLA
ncbi:hypothetical protein MMC07_007163 [Pseudocyphellaria aurata]|nr:hypothetical protein [Pseudocyphellaria aurata]